VAQPVSKGELLATVCGYDFDPGTNVVGVCIRRLRSKLGFDLIKTVRGEGYQLAGQLPVPAQGIGAYRTATMTGYQAALTCLNCGDDDGRAERARAGCGPAGECNPALHGWPARRPRR
ncbi:MAG: winged helix-turn-helix transcriptional regulator, partial [Streptosporangiaceae bacterium]|nr:winged helix-turn-helix transcriptional regulator [Streptosporangiaceae bacterium]